MKALFVVCLWLFTLGASAGPVPLFSVGTPIAADNQVRVDSKYIPDFKATHPITLNPPAFGADIVTVELNGKLHTFEMHPAPMQGRTGAAWVGEDDDNSYSSRPELRLTRQSTGAYSGDIFLPPKSIYLFQPKWPGVLVEMESDMGIRPGPGWLPFLRLAGFLILGECLLALGIGYVWQRAGSPGTSASRLACADAVILGATILLFALIAASMDPEADGNPAHLDMVLASKVLFYALASAALVYWRVRATASKGSVPIWRAGVEGFVGAGAVYLLVPATLGSHDYATGDQLPLLGRCLVIAGVGAGVGFILRAVNRYWLNGVNASMAPS